MDRERWAARLERWDDLGQCLEVAAGASLVLGLAVFGLAALIGVPVVPSVVLGVVIPTIGLVVVWVRARRRGSSPLDDL